MSLKKVVKATETYQDLLPEDKGNLFEHALFQLVYNREEIQGGESGKLLGAPDSEYLIAVLFAVESIHDNRRLNFDSSKFVAELLGELSVSSRLNGCFEEFPLIVQDLFAKLSGRV
ncbi:MAG: hypothetical protein R3B41_04090 [Candidatus Doudnabacteria bacterium]